MTDLISREAAVDHVKSVFCKGCNNYDGIRCQACEVDDVLLDVFDGVPAVDAEPVRHGRWIEPDYVYFGAKRYICNQCKDDEYWENRYHNYKENYCPNCGARMDLEVNV
jgi:hypothetical protein